MSKIKTQTVMWVEVIRPHDCESTSELRWMSVTDIQLTSQFFGEFGRFKTLMFWSERAKQEKNRRAAQITGRDIHGELLMRKCEEEWLVADVPVALEEWRVRHWGRVTRTKLHGERIVSANTAHTKRVLCRDRAGYNQVMAFAAKLQSEAA